mgnify:CR=1 FL=1
MNTALFTTTKTGSSKDKVQVKIQFAFDYKTIIENDLATAQAFTPTQVFELATEKGISCTMQDCEDALTGVKHGRTGLITSLQNSLTEDPNKTNVYENHPSVAGVKVSTKSGDLYCTGLLLEETILEKDPNPEIKNRYQQNWNKDHFGPLVIPKGKIFVLGDNRDNSIDSRIIGLIDAAAIKGVYWKTLYTASIK